MAMRSGGSDPRAPQHPNDLRCAHCEAPIVYEASMETRGDAAFCCRNCLQAMNAPAAPR
jgi:hypothetical protein